MTNDLRTRLGRIEGVEERRSALNDGPAFWVDGEEILRFEGEATVTIRLTREGIRDRRALLRGDERVRLRSSSGDDWLSVDIREPDDEDLVVELAKSAALARQPGTDPSTPD